MKINEVIFKHDLKQLEEEISEIKDSVTESDKYPDRKTPHPNDKYPDRNEPVEDNGVSEATAPELLKAEMPLVRQIETELHAGGWEKGTEEYDKAMKDSLAFHRKFGKQIYPDDIEEGVMTNMLAKAYDVGAGIKKAAKQAFGMDYQPRTTADVVGMSKPADQNQQRGETGSTATPQTPVQSATNQSGKVTMRQLKDSIAKLPKNNRDKIRAIVASIAGVQ